MTLFTEATFSLPVVATPGQSVSLQTILEDEYGPGLGDFTDAWIFYCGAGYLQTNSDFYFAPANPIVTSWSLNDQLLTPYNDSSSTNWEVHIAPSQYADVTFNAGNELPPFAGFIVPVATPDSSQAQYLQYQVFTVNPAVMSPTAGNGAPNPSDIVASAERFASFYGFVPDDTDCTYLSQDVAAAAGATFPIDSTSFDPTQNVSGGFWRIVYRGSDPNPLSNWQTLLQPGDVVRLEWTDATPQFPGHMTTVLSTNSNGTITSYDDSDYVNGQYGFGIHTWTIDGQYSVPTSITIYRLSPDHLYLIDGTGQDEIIDGNNFNDQIDTNGGNDIVNLGTGDNLVDLDGTGNSMVNAGSGSNAIHGGTGANTVDYSHLTTTGLVAIIQGGGGTVNKGGVNGNDTLTGVLDLFDDGTSRSNGDVFKVDAGEIITANSSNFNYLIELSAGVNLAYGMNFTGIAEFVANVGANTVSFAGDTSFAYLYGSTGNDTLTLGSGGGYLFGEGGTNILNGGAGATNLFVGGAGGSDTMNGGSGTAGNYYFVDSNDQVNGAGAFNAMIELISAVTVQLGSSQYQDVQEFVANGGANTVTVANTDAGFKYLYGGAGNDTLSTGSGGGYLFGEDGTNLLNGGGGLNVFVSDGASGTDTMNGGTDSNIYYIDSNSRVNGAGTFNTVIELQQNATLTLGSSQLGNDVQQVILNGGTNTADFHTATSTVYLYGGAGNDTLFGGTGNDFLYGGLGTNTFEFASGWGQDTIEDWTAGSNSQIDLTALALLGVHAITDLSQTITNGNDVITSSHTGSNSITLMGVGSALSAGSFHFA